MANPLAKPFLVFAHGIVSWLRSAAPPSVRRMLRSLLGSHAISAVDYLVTNNALVSMQKHYRSMQAIHPDLAEEYNRLLAGNAADLLAKVIRGFYSSIGADVHSIPLVRGLGRFQERLMIESAKAVILDGAPTLLLFERAWESFQRGYMAEAIRLFTNIFEDKAVRKQAKRDPFLKEAVVRSGEILAQHYESIGDLTNSIAIYQDIITVEPGGVPARRLTLLMVRAGRLREAARIAEMVVTSRPNLFPFLRPNTYVTALKAELVQSGDAGHAVE
jgi:hypothetical protein